MKTLLTSFLLAAAVASVASQTTIPPGMAYVPYTRLNYDYWRDIDNNIRIKNHYAAQYVESNYQYQWYLICLKAWGQDSLWQLAQPNPNVWEIPSLTNEQQAFLKAKYWTAKEFEHFPVVGLDYEQVKRYLDWKTDMLELAEYRIFSERGDPTYGQPCILPVACPKSLDAETQAYFDKITDLSKKPRSWSTFRLPTAQELFAELPIQKKTSGKTPKTDKALVALLKALQPEYGVLAYEPPKIITKKSELQLALEALGVRPVLASDLNKLKKRKDAANLPLLCMEQHFPNHFYEEGFVFACDEEDLKNKQADPNFNPKNLQIVVFDPKKAGTVAWVSNKERLVTMSIANLDERPLCGFRAIMTKVD